MQSKGAIRFVAILLAIACLWQLSFTLVTKVQENKAAKYAEAAVAAAENSAAFAKVSEMDKAFYLDSIRKVENRHYIDSISSEKVSPSLSLRTVCASLWTEARLREASPQRTDSCVSQSKKRISPFGTP